jgi:crotonobetainyl-CoA:carnitine CoA-transferase CaiB-like acyl-CoA transferase
LRARIVEAFSHMTAEQVVQRLEEAKIANANVNTMADVWHHPQLAARERWRTVASPVGEIPALLPPGLTDARMDPIPAVGEHTDAILSEIGCSAAQVAQLHADGVV